VTFDDFVPAGGGGRFTAEIPDGWQQGRGTFGGLVLGVLARAGEQTVADPDRSLRALAGEIVGPVQAGRVDITVEILRAGSGVTTISARLLQGGEVQAHATAAFGKARATFSQAPAIDRVPRIEGWRELPVAPIGPPMAPVFTQHVEYRVVGPPPFSGAPAGSAAEGWVRLRAPGRRRDDAFGIAMIDCWWPAMLQSETQPKAAATLTFAYERCSDLRGLDPEAPFYYRGRILTGADGYAVESRQLWGHDGRLVALNQQTFVLMT
jgi:acyl-CoA thioesterase